MTASPTEGYPQQRTTPIPQHSCPAKNHIVPFSQHPKHPPRGSRVLILTALDSLSSGTKGQDNRRVRAPKRKRKKKEKRQSYPAGFYALLVRGFSNGQQAGFTVMQGRGHWVTFLSLEMNCPNSNTSPSHQSWVGPSGPGSPRHAKKGNKAAYWSAVFKP